MAALRASARLFATGFYVSCNVIMYYVAACLPCTRLKCCQAFPANELWRSIPKTTEWTVFATFMIKTEPTSSVNGVQSWLRFETFEIR